MVKTKIMTQTFESIGTIPTLTLFKNGANL